jgi:hypothetical protein
VGAVACAVDFRQNFNSSGMDWLLEFAVFYVAALTAYRLLMTWVYANTQSLLPAVLMHASYTGWLFVLYPATSLEQGLVWQTAFAVALRVVHVQPILCFADREPSSDFLRRRLGSLRSSSRSRGAVSVRDSVSLKYPAQQRG